MTHYTPKLHRGSSTESRQASAVRRLTDCQTGRNTISQHSHSYSLVSHTAIQTAMQHSHALYVDHTQSFQIRDHHQFTSTNSKSNFIWAMTPTVSSKHQPTVEVLKTIMQLLKLTTVRSGRLPRTQCSNHTKHTQQSHDTHGSFESRSVLEHSQAQHMSRCGTHSHKCFLHLISTLHTQAVWWYSSNASLVHTQEHATQALPAETLYR